MTFYMQDIVYFLLIYKILVAGDVNFYILTYNLAFF